MIGGTMDTRAALKEAVETGEVLTVVYHGGTQPGTKRRLAPVGIIGEHLRALALPHEQVRTYFVDRVEVVPPDHPAPDYDPERSPVEAESTSYRPTGRALTIEFDVSDLSQQTHDIAPEDREHAIDGSYDETCFIDPKAGAFRFPKYDTGADSLVRVRDKTRYNRDNFMTLEDKPLWEYTIDDFEHDFDYAEFDIPSIECLFRPKNKQHFAPFDYLIRAKNEIDALEGCLEDRRRNPFVRVTSKVYAQLERDGFATEVPLDREFVLKELNSKYQKADLVTVAEKNGIKAALLERLLDAGALHAQKAVRPTDRFETLIVALVDVYLTDIRKNTDHFHPRYLEWLWEEVADANDGQWEYLDARIDEIRNEQYWLNRLEVPAYLKQSEKERSAKRWWQVWR
jgi:hypothetical protein